MGSLEETMNETRSVNRWLIAKVFIAGMFCGAALAVVFMWSAVLV